jgi:CheY-like chemotaxis protein
LRELKYEVAEASRAAAALDHLERNSTVSLLLTDVVMPDMNGRRLAAEALRRQPTLKIVYMSGFTRDAIVHSGMLDPGVNLLQKPFTMEQLAWKLRTVLDGN